MKICYIGASGHWQYTLNQVKKYEIVGICPGFDGEDMSALKKVLSDLGCSPKVFDNYRDMLDCCDIAVVNTRFDLNAEISAEFLKRNIYVFSEKPLATTKKQLDMLLASQAQSDAFIVSMFGIRFSGWFLTLKNAVQNLGYIRMINTQKSYKLGVRPDFYKNRDTFGGLIPWVAIHAIDWIHDLCGEELCEFSALSDNSYNSLNGDLEMTALCQFKTKSGILASVGADYFRPAAAPTHDDDRVRVVCTDGVAEYSDGEVTIIDKDGKRSLELFPDEDIFELFVRRVLGEDVGVTPDESFYVTELALDLRKSADLRTHRKKGCGLVSVSFRNKTPEEIVNAAINAGLSYIEWGSDVHVPAGDIEAANNVRKLCRNIKVSSYGTYYRLGENHDIEPYIESACVLGAPILRIWAGSTGSRETDDDTRQNLVFEAKSVCRAAAKKGLRVDFEYHPGTLTDDPDSAYSLLSEIDEPNCGIYWQPNYEKSFSENIYALKKVLPYVDIIHIFFWDKSYNRFFLKDGAAEISEFLFTASEKNPLVLLEFVPEDKIEYLKGEAETLFTLLP